MCEFPSCATILIKLIVCLLDALINPPIDVMTIALAARRRNALREFPFSMCRSADDTSCVFVYECDHKEMVKGRWPTTAKRSQKRCAQHKRRTFRKCGPQKKNERSDKRSDWKLLRVGNSSTVAEHNNEQ